MKETTNQANVITNMASDNSARFAHELALFRKRAAADVLVYSVAGSLLGYFMGSSIGKIILPGKPASDVLGKQFLLPRTIGNSLRMTPAALFGIGGILIGGTIASHYGTKLSTDSINQFVAKKR